MPVVIVANPKGGVGKSTIATNVAGYWANRGHNVMLGDVDRQQSSRLWLDLRPPEAKPVGLWDVQRDFIVRPPRDASHVVLDTPAGLRSLQLRDALRYADRVVVPLQAGIFDIYATHDFIDELRDIRGSADLAIGLVGMRVNERSLAADQLRRFMGDLGYPVVAMLRQTQNYVHVAARGLSIFDVSPSRVAVDLEQWRKLCDWLNRD